MKKLIILLLAAALMVFAFTGCLQEAQPSGADTTENVEQTQEEQTQTTEQSSEDGFGARGAFAEDQFELEDMLMYAIQDEYLARQEYESIMEEYGEQRPFSNIIKAEETHIEMLKELYETYGIEIPEDTAIDHVVVPESLDIAFELGVQAEIDNIAMYDKFLEQDIPDDVRTVFIELRDASKNHLAAFEKGPRGQGNGG
jgi:hypothetical protein